MSMPGKRDMFVLPVGGTWAVQACRLLMYTFLLMPGFAQVCDCTTTLFLDSEVTLTL